MPTFQGRIEARIAVPTGGAAVSASNGGGGPTTVTVPAGNYYMTAAGGVSSLITELQSQLNSSRPPSSGSWTVSMSSTTGLCTVACAEPASVSWTSTALRDVLGFEYDFDYPQTPAQMATALGYGTWTNGAGYLCNESSGDLASVFGTPATLTANSLVYSNQGARGGADKAISCDAGGDYADGGSTFNLTATDDLIVVWVAYHTANSVAGGAIASKRGATGLSRWMLWRTNTGTLQLVASDASTTYTTGLTNPLNGWYVGIACIDRSTNRMRVGYCMIGGSPQVASETNISAMGSPSNANNFRIGSSATGTTPADIDMKLSAFYIVTGSGVATGLSANLSTALSNFAAYMKSQTGTQQCKGVWLPDCPLMLNGDPTQAPRVSDLRTSQSPTGVVLGLAGNAFYRHTGLVYSHVPRAQVWDSAATYENGSWEEFFYETQMGMGSSWFTPATPVQIYYQSAGSTALLGGDFNGTGVSGWTITGLDAIEPKKAIDQWTGLFRIELGTLVSSG